MIMRKILSIFAAMLVALAVNAAETPVNPGSGTLKAAVDAAAAGDVLVLADGVYSEPEVVDLNKDLTIQAAEDAHPVVAQQYYMKLLNSAKVTFIGIKFDGGLYNDGQGANDHCIRAYDATAGKTLTVIDCEFCNWKSYILYPQRADRCADALIIRNCYFHDNKRCAVFTENEAGALGALTIENSTFANFTEVSEALIAVKNGGAEEANQAIRVDHCTFYNYVKNSTGDYSFIDVRKSTDVAISNCIFAQPEEGMSKATYCYGGTIDNCLIFNTTGHRSGNCVVSNGIVADPLFVDATNGDYTLGEGSPALTAATDGGAIGDPRWVPSDEPALENGYYLVGTMNNWQVEAEYKLVLNEQADDTEYMYDITFAEEDRFKVVDYQNGNWTWHPGEGDGYVIAADHVGEATVYFRPNGKQGDESWYYTIIYVAMKEEPVDAPYFAYTVTETIAKNTETAATGGIILFGADKFETMDGTELFGYKLDGNPSESGTKYVLCKLDRPLAAGDVISITGFASSNPKEGQAFQVSLDRAGSQVVGTAATTVAKAIETVDIPVNAVAVDATEFYITRVSASVYFTGVEVHAEAGPGTGVDNIKSADAAHKMIIDGKLVIIKNGVRYNVMGMQL